MEIYKLKDEVPEKWQNSKKGVTRKTDDSRNELKITEMRQGVKNPGRVNVYVNGAYELSLDVAQIVDYRLRVGLVISTERLGELRKASVFGKLYQRTLEWVLLRPRSVRETKDYLFRRLRISPEGHPQSLRGRNDELHKDGREERPEEDCSEFSRVIIERLISRGYLDDRRFAEWWVENRFVKKGVSRKRLMMDLMKKGVARKIIDEVLDGRNDEEELRKMIARKRSKYDDEKLTAYLCRQGFSYDLVRKMIEEE
ncbi:RecX family transcriptional regulator [Candidatus Saccharibacteria bacterium]|nr:RecX family transcriptional regulator [Candidatus Saccharibacteria bacterium]